MARGAARVPRVYLLCALVGLIGFVGGCISPWGEHSCQLHIERLDEGSLNQAVTEGALTIDVANATREVPFLVDAFRKAEREGRATLGEPEFNKAWDYMGSKRQGPLGFVVFEETYFEVAGLCP